MTDSGATSEQAGGSASIRANEQAMVAVLAAGSFVVTWDYAAVLIPLPSILEDLGGTLDEATWVILGIVLAFAVFLVPCARLAERFGPRRLFLCGVVLFTTPQWRVPWPRQWGS